MVDGSNEDAARQVHLTVFEEILVRTVGRTSDYYGERLVSLVVFGSVGRGAPGPTSDLDLLLVAEPLPRGRVKRMDEFRRAVEDPLLPLLAEAWSRGVHTRFAPVFKTRQEVLRGSPLFLDMTEDGRILVDRDGFFAGCLADLRRRLAALGSRRIWTPDGRWYWLLKPGYRPGEVFEI